MSNRAKKTSRPKIYGNTHWSNFSHDKYKTIDKNTKIVYTNRNKFVERFNIKKTLKKARGIQLLLNIEFHDDIEKSIEKHAFYGIKELVSELKIGMPNRKWYDHVEVYKTNDEKIIVVSSPYQKNDEHYRDFLERTGFINMTEPFYGFGAISFYKIFDKHETQVGYLTEKLKQMLNKYKNSVK